MNLKKYLGDRRFYRMVLAVAVPIMVQNGITNFVSLLDNIMVGSLGTESMSGVSIVNQFVFVFYLMIFGATSAAGIFTAQYHGLGDRDGVRHTFRFKMYINLAVGAASVLAFGLFGTELIGTFLHDGSTEGDLALTLSEGLSYLNVMLIGLIPYVISQVYASTMRETGDAFLPMIASIVAVATNFVLNVVLIFGYLGAPALGVKGAALATVISRFAELAVLVVWGHTHTDKCGFLVGAYRSLRVPRLLTGRIMLKGLPLMLNELFWSLAITMRNQCYSTRGLDVVAAQNINSTIENLFNVVYLALGTSISIVVGNLLGAGKLDEAKDNARRMGAFSVMSSVGISVLLVSVAWLFPLLYNTGEDVRSLATFMILITALFTPFRAFAHAAYFTLRSGGKVMITILFDSVYTWVIVIPVATILAKYTTLGIALVFFLVQSLEFVKAIIGYFMVKSGVWLQNIVEK